MRKVFWTLFVLLISTSASSQQLALVNGTAIPVTGAQAIENAVVLIDDGRITRIGENLEVPSGYEVLDVRGKWITPGIIDTNVHLILTTIPEFFIKYEDRLTDIAIQSAQVGLKYGLTTMPDTWGPLPPLLEARDRINSGEFVGSRILVAGNIIGTGGPFSQSFMGGWPLNGLTVRYGGWVRPEIRQRIDALWEDDVGPAMIAMTPEEAALTLRKYIAKGVDFVKIGVSGHGLGAVEPLLFSPAVLEAMRKEVRAAGIPLTTHTFTIESLRLAVQMEPDLLLHPNVMSPSWEYATDKQREAITSLMAQIAAKGIYAGLMMVPEENKSRIYAEWDYREHTDTPSLNRIMDERQFAMAGVSHEKQVAGLKAWLDSGIKYTLATDQGPDSTDLGPVAWGRLGRMHFGRMIGLQEAGASPMEVLVASTRAGAEAYGLEKTLGTLEAGKIADMLVLDADPLLDIANMRKINAVIKDGKIVDREALPTVKVLDYDPSLPWPF